MDQNHLIFFKRTGCYKEVWRRGQETAGERVAGQVSTRRGEWSGETSSELQTEWREQRGRESLRVTTILSFFTLFLSLTLSNARSRVYFYIQWGFTLYTQYTTNRCTFKWSMVWLNHQPPPPPPSLLLMCVTAQCSGKLIYHLS